MSEKPEPKNWVKKPPVQDLIRYIEYWSEQEKREFIPIQNQIFQTYADQRKMEVGKIPSRLRHMSTSELAVVVTDMMLLDVLTRKLKLPLPPRLTNLMTACYRRDPSHFDGSFRTTLKLSRQQAREFSAYMAKILESLPDDTLPEPGTPGYHVLLKRALKKIRLNKNYLADLFGMVWSEFKLLEPWTRGLFPFKLNLSIFSAFPLTEVMVEMRDDPTQGVMMQVLPLGGPYQNLKYQLVVGMMDGQQKVALMIEGSTEPNTLEDMIGLHALICGMMAVIDLLTVEVRYVEAKQRVQKRTGPDTMLPGLEIEYDPIIYAPRTKTISVGGYADVEVSVEDHGEGEDGYNYPLKRRTRYHVPSFIRHRRMSEKQYNRLVELIAQGVKPVDRFGNEIPLPKNREYTIVLEHNRGEGMPQVISRSVTEYASSLTV